MLEFLSPLRAKFKKTSPPPPIPPPSAPAPSATAAKGEPLTPLLAPQDEKFLAKVAGLVGDQDEDSGKSVVDLDAEKVILPGVTDAASTGSPVLVVEEKGKGEVSEDKTENGEGKGKEGTVTIGKGEGEGVGVGVEPAWKEQLRAKWGYLERNLSVTRLSEMVGVGKKSDEEGKEERKKEEGKEKGKEEGKEEKDKGKGKGKEKAKEKKDKKGKGKEKAAEVPPTEVGQEILQEDHELTTILDQLNLAASHGRILSLPSTSLKPLINNFTQILRDLQSGVPTAYDDLVTLFQNSTNIFEKTYTSLPQFLKQLITSLPDKLTPEVLRTLAVASPALAESAAGLGLKEIVTTPGLLKGLLRSVVEILRLRFPMLLGGGVAVGLGVFVVLFGLWYCWKRGVETREEREERERMERFGVERIPTVKEVDKKEKEEKKAQEEGGEGAAAEKKSKRWSWRM